MLGRVRPRRLRGLRRRHADALSFYERLCYTLGARPYEPIIMTTPHSIVLRHSPQPYCLLCIPVIYYIRWFTSDVVSRNSVLVIAAFAYRIRGDKSVVKRSDPRYLYPRVSGKYSAASEFAACVWCPFSRGGHCMWVRYRASSDGAIVNISIIKGPASCSYRRGRDGRGSAAAKGPDGDGDNSTQHTSNTIVRILLK